MSPATFFPLIHLFSPAHPPLPRQVAVALNDIWQVPRHRPFVLFYDRSCFRVKYLEQHPDPLWGMTINVTDRQAALTCDIHEECFPLQQLVLYTTRLRGERGAGWLGQILLGVQGTVILT